MLGGGRLLSSHCMSARLVMLVVDGMITGNEGSLGGRQGSSQGR